MEVAVADGGRPEGVRRLGIWLLLAGVVMVAGSAGSYVDAAGMARQSAHIAAQKFHNDSVQVTEQIQQEITHEEDLVVNAGVFAANQPVVTDHAFNQWATESQVLSRYPEMISMAYIAVVPNSQLTGFEAQVEADPPGGPPADQPFVVNPPGNREFYCLASASLSTSTGSDQPASTSVPQFPTGYDYCQGATGALTLTTRDLGTPIYFPFPSGNQTYLVVGVAVYRGGLVPQTVSARRKQFDGVLGFIMQPDVILSSGLSGQSGLGVSFSYDHGTTNIAFTNGRILARDRSDRTVLTNGWAVRTFAALPSPAITSDGSALGLLVAGIGWSAAIASLVLVLATGRHRALRLVRQKTAEIQHQALHDALTDLPNRALVVDRAEQLLERNRRAGSGVAALFLDLDGFKNVNDTMGHEVGDELLQAVAGRLRSCLRSIDTIGRFGGDEFVVLLDGAGGEADGPDLVAERIVEALRIPFQLRNVAHPVMTSISIGVATGHRASAKQLIRDADLALYQAKANGKNRVCVYNPDLNSTHHRRNQLQFDARAALDQGQLKLVYQPMYDLEDLTILGFEALLRWQHPEFGAIRPDEFIPVMEASGDIVETGRWVLSEACRQVAYWRQFRPDLTVAVNVSAVQLDRDVIVDHVAEALRDSRLSASCLTLEITESGLMRHIESSTVRLHQLKALGVQLAIDDFGTGYSSLAYLQKLPVDCLKIDRSFTQSVQSCREADLVIHSMVELGKHVGLRTVAEGVENMMQVDYMRHERVDQVQGFLFARPTDARTIEAEFLFPSRLALPRSEPET